MINACEILLRADIRTAATSLGLNSRSTDSLITEENLFTIINEIELALLEGGQDEHVASACGLLWTHFSKKFDLLAEYIFSTMTKLGFAPVVSMLGNGPGEDRRISGSSLLTMLETSIEMRREALDIFNEKIYLTRFQKALWTKLERYSHIAVSAPTSAGKSFLICLNLIHGIFLRGGKSIYIVPTLTLMSQVANDLIELNRKFSTNIFVRTHLDDADDEDRPTVYVLTQERLAEHSRSKKKFGQLNYLIIDEVQNIERAFDYEDQDIRSKLLLDVLTDLHDNLKPAKTVILGPRINEVSTLGERLFGRKCSSVVAVTSPVTNISYSLTPAESGRVKLTQYSNLPGSRYSITTENKIGAVGFEKSRYDEDYHQFLINVLAQNKSSLIFMPTASQARKTAVRISGGLALGSDERLEQLAKYIEATVSDRYDLAICIRKGVAFHHGKIPQHVRNAIELAISDGRLNYVTCTTTLMQGVNLPAQSIFIRNPNLFINRKGSSPPKLSGYEIANLRGRAGRLLKDFVGRTFILDGTSFEDEEEQLSLFQPSNKTLDGSYSGIFTRHREEILESLSQPNQERGTLAKYISNLLYTHADGAARLSRRGIELSREELLGIKSAQRKLKIDRSICQSHRFWDPFDLQTLSDYANEFKLPQLPSKFDSADELADLLYKFMQILPRPSEQYLNQKKIDKKVLKPIAITAMGWATEKPLRDLLNTDWAKASSDNTDEVISSLQRTISYGIPALLSPLYAMRHANTKILSALERGAYREVSMLQINNNIPRETAIAVTKRAKRDEFPIKTIADVLEYLAETRVGYWSAIQYRHLTDAASITR
jgi:hypothetical protein